MERTKIECVKILADVLISLGVATNLVESGNPVETPQTPKPDAGLKTLWETFVLAVKASEMTEAMKVACVAQAILESGRGNSKVSSICNNFWGIKMRDELAELAVGQRVEVTSEDKGWDIFAKFTSCSMGIKGWLKFLTRSYYAGWEEHKDDSEAFIKHIGKSWCPRADYADVVIANIPEAKKLLGTATVPTTPTTPPVMGAIEVVLNAGHAGTTGASGKNKAIQEHLENAFQCDVVKQILERRGFTVRVENQDKHNQDLLATGMAAKGGDCYIAFHQNAADGVEHGAEVLVGSNATDASKKLAARISAAMAATLGIQDRGVKDQSVSVIKGAQSVGVPIVMLTECQFIDDETDPAAARKKTELSGIAIANEVLKWFGK